jgi:hypothetical protein
MILTIIQEPKFENPVSHLFPNNPTNLLTPLSDACYFRATIILRRINKCTGVTCDTHCQYKLKGKGHPITGHQGPRKVGWAPGPVWTCAKNLAPTGIFFNASFVRISYFVVLVLDLGPLGRGDHLSVLSLV